MTGKDLEDFDLYAAVAGRIKEQTGDGVGESDATKAQPNLGGGGAAHNVVVQDYAEVESRIIALVPKLNNLEPHLHGGRKPKLLRYEVDMIRADGRSTRHIAQDYGVSENTIRRVKQIGVYRGVPYIPADEYVRDVTLDGNGEPTPLQAPMSERQHGPRRTTKKIGRPFPSGRPPFNHKELVDIASSDLPLREIAEKYDVSIGTIYNTRKRLAQSFPEGMTDIVQVALNDPRTPKQLSQQYGMSEKWFAEVREQGYAMSSDGPITRLKEGDQLVVNNNRRGGVLP